MANAMSSISRLVNEGFSGFSDMVLVVDLCYDSVHGKTGVLASCIDVSDRQFK